MDKTAHRFTGLLVYIRLATSKVLPISLRQGWCHLQAPRLAWYLLQGPQHQLRCHRQPPRPSILQTAPTLLFSTMKSLQGKPKRRIIRYLSAGNCARSNHPPYCLASLSVQTAEWPISSKQIHICSIRNGWSASLFPTCHNITKWKTMMKTTTMIIINGRNIDEGQRINEKHV